MMSPNFLLNTQNTSNSLSPSLSETSLQSPLSDSAILNTFMYRQPNNLPIQCYQTIMPPPPHHNVLSTINNNNNVNNNNNNTHSKNYNSNNRNSLNNSWNSSSRKNFNTKETNLKTNDSKNGNGKETKDNKEKDCNNQKQENRQNECSRLSPIEKKTSAEVKERNVEAKSNVNQNTATNFYYSSNHHNHENNGQYFYYSPHHQRNSYNQHHKNRYFSNRSNYKHKNQLSVSPERNTPLVDILAERFLSHAENFGIVKNPENLLITGSEFDILNCQIWDYYMSMQQSETMYKQKIMLWKEIYKFLGNYFPRYGLFLVGSTLSGFGTNTSDVDMCLLIRQNSIDQRHESLAFLDFLHNKLCKCSFVSNVEIISAKVPILKFHDHERNLNVDLNCNNSVGIRNTHLLRCYASLDWRLRPLVLIVKLWARSNNINDAKNMTISSYSLALMVIHFLQCGVTPPVIPCLHGLYPGKFYPFSDIHSIDMWEQLKTFHSDNHQSLGELFLGFLHYYSHFEYNLYAISVRLGARIPIDECRMAKSSRNDPHQWKLLCIEEPFDLTNTARSVYDLETFENIKTVFRNSYSTLHETRELFSIFKNSEKSS